MPGVLRYTPSWLSRPSPGYSLFTPTPESKPTVGEEKSSGALRTIAHRGSEIFVAVGKELRWSDLHLLKERWEDQNESDARSNGVRTSYRVLKVPISRKIKQLSISPRGDYLAILTSHTIHVALLPDTSHLSSDDTSSIKLKTYHVGPTTHVLERSAIACALWHPLGVNGSCLVTITVDAVVRIWELNRDNKWSFDAPALGIDLRKLANGTSASEDFSPSKYGISNGFSPDSFEMEVASACFGGSGRETELAWASMTLWVAMQEGDVYALCPLLPSKWESAPSLLPRLASLIAYESDSTDELNGMGNIGHKLNSEAADWMQDLSSNNQGLADEGTFRNERVIFQRPQRPGPVPKLQGPFKITPNGDDILNITDISAFAGSDLGTIPAEDMLESESQKMNPSTGTLCLATSDGTVHICLDIGGVEGCWLKMNKTQISPEDGDDELYPELLLIESLTMSKPSSNFWSIFSKDPQSENGIFLTHSHGVSHIDCAPWLTKLRAELDESADAGTEFRLDLILESAASSVTHPIHLPEDSVMDDSVPVIPACVGLIDGDLGYLLLTTVNDEPQVVTLEEDLDMDDALMNGLADGIEDLQLQRLLPEEQRPNYQPPRELWIESALPTFLEQHFNTRGRRFLTEEVRLSPAMFNLLTDAHRILSQETYRVGLAAASIFRRCERLREEFAEQLKQVHEAANRIEAVTDDDMEAYDDGNEDTGAAAKIDRRLESVISRQNSLEERYVELRRKLNRLNGRPLSEKEAAWQDEIMQLDSITHEKEAPERNGVVSPLGAELAIRYNDLKALQSEVLGDYREHEEYISMSEKTGALEEMLDNRRASAAIETMLDRQTALIEATRSKLERLNAMST